MSKIHIVSHSHWDREWYRPFQYFKIRLTYFMDQVLDVLEKNDRFRHYMLDGQTVMIEDYLELRPENRARITALVRAGRLVVGPWYSQPDEFAPSAESLVRNLLIGTSQSDAFGATMKVGHLPDAFGQCAQMPQILKGFDIHSATMMRGVPVHKLKAADFKWQALNGDEVLATALTTGYSNGMFMPKDPKSMDLRLKKAAKDLHDLGNESHILIMEGVDHQLIKPFIGDYVASKTLGDDTIVHTTLEGYFEHVRQEEGKLVTICGEMISPETNRVHTSIASSRIYQKTENRRLEIELTKKLEPIMSMAYILGADYPTANVNSAWKLMLQNQAHDSICGCCTDEVHREIDQRFTDVDNITKTLQHMFTRSIAESVSEDDLVLLVYNHSMTKGIHRIRGFVYTTSQDFTLEDSAGIPIDYALISSELIDAASLSIWTLYLGKECQVYKSEIQFELEFSFNIGYKVLKLLDGQVPIDKGSTVPLVQDNVIHTDYYVITINGNGTINLMDKENHVQYDGLNAFEDCGCAGDTYNYSPVINDLVIESQQSRCHSEIITSGRGLVIKTNHKLMVPKSLSEDGISRSEDFLELSIQSELMIYKDSRRIDVVTTLDNTVSDHRLRALFPTGIQTDHSVSETHFGRIQRPYQIEEADKWQVWHWKEKPLPIYSQHRYVTLNNGSYGLAILNKGLTEYEIYADKNSTIAITLIRGVGMMGKSDLVVRPGRPSGIPVEAPEAQCHGIRTLEYSIYPYNGSVDEAYLTREANIYTADIEVTQNRLPMDQLFIDRDDFFRLYEIPRMNSYIVERMKDVPKTAFSLVTISNDHLLISSFKKSEGDEAVILRLYNPTSQPLKKIQITLGFEAALIYACNLGEKNLNEIDRKSSRFTIESVKGNTAVTFKLYMKEKTIC